MKTKAAKKGKRVARPKWAPVPRITTPTITVRGLLERIRDLAKEDYRRIDMRTWIRMLRGAGVSKSWLVKERKAKALPACGSIGCMFGWGAMLLRPSGMTQTKLADRAEDLLRVLMVTPRPGYGGDDNAAQEAWDRDWFAINALSGADALEQFGETRMPRAGTQAHAMLVAKRIDTFLAQHPDIGDRVIDVKRVREDWR